MKVELQSDISENINRYGMARVEINNDIKLWILSPCYNVGKELMLCYNSLKVQSYINWRWVIIDDHSSDNTAVLAQKIVIEDSRVFYTYPDDKKYQLGNWIETIKEAKIPNNDIIVYLDADDWLGSRYVLEGIVKEFKFRKDLQVLTSSNFNLSDYHEYDGELFVDRGQLLMDKKHKFFPLAYKAGLIYQIPEWYWKDQNGDYFKVCGDYCLTLALLWLAGPEHYHHLHLDRGVIYNDIRSECDSNKVLEDGTKVQTLVASSIFENFLKFIKLRKEELHEAVGIN